MLNDVKIFFLLIFIFINCKNPFLVHRTNPDISYSPLHVGDEWVYESKHTIGQTEKRSEEYIAVIEVTGTEKYNGKKYFKLIKYYINSKEFSDKILIVYKRIDKVNGLVYKYDKNKNKEYLADDLTAEPGDIIESCHYSDLSDYYVSTKVISESHTFVFGINSISKEYCERYYYEEYNYQLVKDFGLFLLQHAGDFFNRTERLKGCIINNKVYGDTTKVF